MPNCRIGFSPPDFHALPLFPLVLQSLRDIVCPEAFKGFLSMAISEQAGAFCLGALASGGGTNLQAILDRCASGELPARVGVVISNNSDAGALERARRAGVPTVHLSSKTHPDPDALDRAITDVLQSHGVNLVLLAGYMKKLGAALVQAFPNRILNIHPALLPAFGGEGMYGLRVHRAVIESGARITGVTVHLADEEYDHGPIVDQEAVRVDQDDTPESLAARVLEVEHHLYSAVIRLFAEGRVDVDGRRVRILTKT